MTDDDTCCLHCGRPDSQCHSDPDATDDVCGPGCAACWHDDAASWAIDAERHRQWVGEHSRRIGDRAHTVAGARRAYLDWDPNRGPLQVDNRFDRSPTAGDWAGGGAGPVLAARYAEWDPDRADVVRRSGTRARLYRGLGGEEAAVPLTSADQRWDGGRARARSRADAARLEDVLQHVRRCHRTAVGRDEGIRRLVVPAPRGLIGVGDWGSLDAVRRVSRAVLAVIVGDRGSPAVVETAQWWGERTSRWHAHADVVISGATVRLSRSSQRDLTGDRVGDPGDDVEWGSLPRSIRRECRRRGGHADGPCDCLTLRRLRRVAAAAWRAEYPDASIPDECVVYWDWLAPGRWDRVRRRCYTPDAVDAVIRHRVSYCVRRVVEDATGPGRDEWVAAWDPSELRVALDWPRGYRRVRRAGCLAPRVWERLSRVIGDVAPEPVVPIHPVTGSLLRPVSCGVQEDRALSLALVADDRLIRPPPTRRLLSPRYVSVADHESAHGPLCVVEWIRWSEYQRYRDEISRWRLRGIDAVGVIDAPWLDPDQTVIPRWVRRAVAWGA